VLWERFKKHASRKSLEVSTLPEDLMKNEMSEETVDGVQLNLECSDNHDVDLPVGPEIGLVSELVRAVRDERSYRIAG
jgi:hypothetical protein